MKEIRSWGERAAEKFQADQILYEEAKQQTVIDCMRAEIIELRAFLEKLSTEPVAEYDGVEFSRHTIRWTSGPMPVGTKLYAAPAIQQPQDAAVIAEREACALECERIANHNTDRDGRTELVWECAAAIRGRAAITKKGGLAQKPNADCSGG